MSGASDIQSDDLLVLGIGAACDAPHDVPFGDDADQLTLVDDAKAAHSPRDEGLSGVGDRGLGADDRRRASNQCAEFHGSLHAAVTASVAHHPALRLVGGRT